MPHRVVEPFPFSENGFTLVDLNVGDERDFGHLAAGLVAIGWIEPIDSGASTDDAAGKQSADLNTNRVRGRRK